MDYSFEVEYLRALLLNSELRTFACQIDLTIISLFVAALLWFPFSAGQ